MPFFGKNFQKKLKNIFLACVFKISTAAQKNGQIAVFIVVCEILENHFGRPKTKIDKLGFFLNLWGHNLRKGSPNLTWKSNTFRPIFPETEFFRIYIKTKTSSIWYEFIQRVLSRTSGGRNDIWILSLVWARLVNN